MFRPLSTLIVTATLSGAFVQTAQRPAFDAASVKPNTSGERNYTNTFLAGGRYVAINATARWIVELAYQPMLRQQIVGGPEWMSGERFDVVARAEGNPSVDMLRLMLQRLLVDRFQLRAHTEARNTQVYALVPARADWRPGPQLTPGSVDCSAHRSAEPPPDSEPRTIPSPDCAFVTFTTNFVDRGIQLRQTAKGITIDQLAAQLSALAPIGRIVVDRTGLTEPTM
jgi:uncharacterized protein (TIGR03435 family)